MDGTRSYDPDSEPIISYDWRHTKGDYPVNLQGATTSTPTFVAPDIGGAEVKLAFELVVKDAHGQSQPSTMTVTVKPRLVLREFKLNHPPTADSFSITTNSTTPKDISFVDSVHDDLDRGDTSTTNVVSQPSDGQGKVININPEEGTATYDPQGFAGETHFTYKATDNHGS